MSDQGRFALTKWPLAAAAGCLLIALAYAITRPPASFHAENGPLEMIQVGLWALAALAAFVGIFSKRSPRERWWMLWLAVLSALAAARELDLHILANPEHAGDWGVRYRLDWWISASAPILPRILWACIFVIIGTLLLVPPLRAKLTPALALRGLRAGHGPFWLIALSAAFMALGWVADDVLRPVRHIYTEIQPLSQAIEELLETCGAGSYLLAILLSWRRPLPPI